MKIKTLLQTIDEITSSRNRDQISWNRPRSSIELRSFIERHLQMLPEDAEIE